MTTKNSTPATPARKRAPRKAKVASDPTYDAFMASARPADAARVIGMDGKRFRGILRGKVGVRVSDGVAFDAAAKAKMWEHTAAHRAKATPSA